MIEEELMTDEEKFIRLKELFGRLCNLYCLPTPKINPSLLEDSCDFTSPEEVRFKVIDNINLIYHAKHVFGHYVTNLEQIDKWSDKVVDLVVEWVGGDLKYLGGWNNA